MYILYIYVYIIYISYHTKCIYNIFVIYIYIYTQSIYIYMCNYIFIYQEQRPSWLRLFIHYVFRFCDRDGIIRDVGHQLCYKMCFSWLMFFWLI